MLLIFQRLFQKHKNIVIFFRYFLNVKRKHLKRLEIFVQKISFYSHTSFQIENELFENTSVYARTSNSILLIEYINKGLVIIFYLALLLFISFISFLPF